MVTCPNCKRSIPKIKFVNRGGEMAPVENFDDFCPHCGGRNWFP